MRVEFKARMPFSKVPPAGEPGLDRMVRRWTELLKIGPENLDRTADREDWVENAIQLIAAAECGLSVKAIGPARRDNALETFLANDAAREETSINAESPCETPRLLLGFGGPANNVIAKATTESPLLWPDVDSAAAVRRYASNPAFEEIAGRFARTAHVPGEGSNGDVIDHNHMKALRNVTRAAAKAARGDPAEIILKVVAVEKYAPLIPMRLSPNATDDAIDAALLKGLGYALAHMEGARDAILVQERIRMHHEYRLFVVDGVPVTGAGCVEAFCPLDLPPTSRAFDDRMENIRGDGDVRPRPDILAEYLQAAPNMIDRLRAADPDLKDFVLDLATDETGKTLAIELNPSWNFGLYAMNFHVGLAAIIKASERRCEKTKQRTDEKTKNKPRDMTDDAR